MHCITYSVIPAQHRILWVNCVDLIWNAILASMSSSSSTEEEETIVPAEEDALFVMRQDILPAAAAAASLEEETSLFSNSTVGTPENVTVY